MERRQHGDAEALEELRARRLTLVDEQGRVRATFGPAGDGSMELRLYDPDDRARAELAVDANGAASLTLRGPDGEMRSCLAVGRNGDTRLHLHGTAAVSLHDREGQPRALLGLDEHSGTATLSYADADGACCLLLTEDGSGGRLHLFQHDGRGRRIPACDPGDPEASAGPPVVAGNPGSGRRWAPAALTVLLSGLLGMLGGHVALPRSRAETTEAIPALRQAETTIHARELILSDAAGMPRLWLSILPDGAPLMRMTDAEGHSAVELGVSTDLGAVVRLNGGTSSSIALVTPPGGPPSLSVSVGNEMLFQAPSHVARYLPPDLWP